MNQKGFVNIIVILIIVGLVGAGAGAYFVLTKQITLPTPGPTDSSSPTPSPISTPLSTSTPTSTSAQLPQGNNILSVLDLTGNKESYVGKRVRVQGRIAVNVFYSARPCPADGSVCDTTMGAQLELWQPGTTYYLAENFVLLFAKNQPYPCNKTSPETYACPPYIDNQITIIEGVWSKDQVPIQWVGSSSGGPPTPIKWGDRYFFNIE